MRHREFVLVRVDGEDGSVGVAYGLTRDGPVASIINRTIKPVYTSSQLEEVEKLFFTALWTSHAVHSAGIGMRALSLVDVATWDCWARSRDLPLSTLLGGTPAPLPATAIVGYPPTVDPGLLASQIEKLRTLGWRRFKVPISPDLDLSEARLRAAREAAPDCWLGFDVNMVLHSPAEVLSFERRIRDLELGWIEDVMPPGDAAGVAAIRAGATTPIAVGDEQGGSYHPEALLAAHAIDVLRVDATTNGGITRMREAIHRAHVARVAISPHMFPHIHSRVINGLGLQDVPIEWGVPGTGVHPMDDGLEQPVIVDGLMMPLSQGPGLGAMVPIDWVLEQEVEDPEELLKDLPAGLTTHAR